MSSAIGINIKKYVERIPQAKIRTDFKSNEERKWRLSYLKEQFESNQLHKLYEKFIKKVNHGYFSLFLIVQTVMSLTHFLLVIFSNYKTKENLLMVLPDLILYLISLLLSLAGLAIVDNVVEKRDKLHVLAVIAFVIIFFMNIFVPVYHVTAKNKYRPTYSCYLVLSCYIFFGIQKLFVCFILGLSVTAFSIITLLLTTYTHDDFLWKRILSDLIILLCFNGLGLYFRYLNEINVRRSFLDRREYIMSTHQHRHEQFQVDQLMSSIIPQYVMDKVKENYIEATIYELNHNKHRQRNPFDNSLLDEHKNVSILFADIVHYTEMTIQLNITELLETLNELFSSFDESSLRFGVSRIKFLGDCYYCVAGLPPKPAKNHAEACVDLGLSMIEIIDKLRKKRNLDVNMRIGVHTGNIISGVIGSVKYQYDIWSKDVDIANKMESEGVPGKVHITNKTKDLLIKSYNITPTNKGETVTQFKQNNLQTFLVSPENTDFCIYHNRSPTYKRQKSLSNSILAHLQRFDSVFEESDDNNSSVLRDQLNNLSETEVDSKNNSNTSTYKRRYTSSNSNSLRRSKIDDSRRSNSEVKRRTGFMNNNLKRYIEQTSAVNAEMEESIQGISFSKYNQYFSKKHDVSALLLFSDVKDELEYITMPDPLFKYYLLAALVLVLSNWLIQNLTVGSRENDDAKNIRYGITVFIIVFVLIPLAFAKYMWDKCYPKHSNELSRNGFAKLLYRASQFITNNFAIRASIYTVLYLLSVFCFLSEAAQCSDDINNTKHLVNQSLLDGTLRYPNCVFPWQMTESCILVLLMTFVFLRMFLWLKVLNAILLIIVQIHGVLRFTKNYYENSETFNYSVHPQVAHILEVSLITLALHTLDRQTDYMNRLTHLLNKKVALEQKEAEKLQYCSRNLLMNILPTHVANLYLDTNREMRDLYYEEHHDTAIMFASIITNDLQEILDEKRFLFLMNGYIKAFDTLINREEFKNIEKIKNAKWTYLAACGLFPDDQSREFERSISKSSLEILLQFVSEMYKKLNIVNREYFQDCKLRVGICHGSILAGVVGSKKPLYDIWGDPVNMASRMDSTGIANSIQVMEDTAMIIEKLGYVCEYRGEIFVKGREGLTKTYFVKLDEEFNLKKNTRSIGSNL